MDKQNKTKTLLSFYDILCVCAAAVLPNVFMFFLYNQNEAMSNISLAPIVILAAFFLVVSIILFVLFKKLIRDKNGALIVLCLFWSLFWMFGNIFADILIVYSVVLLFVFALSFWCFRKITASLIIQILLSIVVVFAASLITNFVIFLFGLNIKEILLLYLLMIVAVVTIFLLLCKSALVLLAVPSKVISVTICLLFLFNFTQAVYSNILFTVGKSKEPSYTIKIDFNIDADLPKPDIYWLHMDGMLGFKAVYDYFGDSQTWLKDALLERGFVINHDAVLKGGYTDIAVPALMSPAFFDSYLQNKIEQTELMLRMLRQQQIYTEMRNDGIKNDRDVFPAIELFKAFMQAGYTQASIADPVYAYVPIDRFYLLPHAFGSSPPMKTDDPLPQTLKETTDLLGLLTVTSALSVAYLPINRMFNLISQKIYKLWDDVPPYNEQVNALTNKTLNLYEERLMHQYLIDTFTIPSPKIVLLANYIAHAPYNRIYETGKVQNINDPNEIEVSYMPQHEYAAKIMLVNIDMIIQENPNAVIIIQGDHGIHIQSDQDYLIDSGFTHDEVLELNYSVISAVRIPNEDSQSSAFAPLNISRFLVNNYIGHNYDYLP